MVTLEGSKEWDKLKCWIGVVWMMWPPEGEETTEEELKHVMFLLSQKKPDAIQELEKQMEQWSGEWPWVSIPKSLQQICKQACENTAQQSGPNKEANVPLPKPITLPSCFEDDTF